MREHELKTTNTAPSFSCVCTGIYVCDGSVGQDIGMEYRRRKNRLFYGGKIEHVM